MISYFGFGGSKTRLPSPEGGRQTKSCSDQKTYSAKVDQSAHIFFFNLYFYKINHGKHVLKMKIITKSRYIIVDFLGCLGAGVCLFSGSSVPPG